MIAEADTIFTGLSGLFLLLLLIWFLWWKFGGRR